MRTTVLVVGVLLCAGLAGCDRGSVAPIVVGFNQDPIVVSAGEVVSVYADIRGGCRPYTITWQWTGPNDWGYGDEAMFRVTPPSQLNASTEYVIKVTVTDNYGHRAEAEKLITVGTPQPVVTNPIANNQAVAVSYQTARSIVLTGSTTSGGALVYTVATNPSHGTLSGTTPSLTYTPSNGFSGNDSFTFRVNDGVRDSSLATVSIVVASSTGRDTTVFLSPNPTEGKIPLTVVFAANTSFDVGVTIVRYQWDFAGDGVFETDTGTVPMASHTYSYVGSYVPRVRVTDSRGQTAENSAIIIGLSP
jgi:hypothetical protein